MRLALIALLLLLVLVWVLAYLPPAQRKRWTLGLAISALLLALLWLAASGRLHWLAALAASILPFGRRLLPLLQYIPLLRRFSGQFRQARPGAGAKPQVSRVATAWLEMTLDHASGRMDGKILQGPRAGQALHDLDIAALRDLLGQLSAADRESADLLRAYLERERAESWQDADTETGDGSAGREQAATDSVNDREEALRILGLNDTADEQAIIDAHRRLMQKLHPDRGGSDYLAAKVNAAKDLLLAQARR